MTRPPLTGPEWPTCREPQRMLAFLQGKTSDRKLWLLAVAGLRSVLETPVFEWLDVLPRVPAAWTYSRVERMRTALGDIERYADHPLAPAALGPAVAEMAAAVEELQSDRSIIDARALETICAERLSNPSELHLEISTKEGLEAQRNRAAEVRLCAGLLAELARTVGRIAKLAGEDWEGKAAAQEAANLRSWVQLASEQNQCQINGRNTEDLEAEAEYCELKAEDLKMSATAAAESVVEFLCRVPNSDERRCAAADLLRDIFGDPFLPTVADPNCQDPRIVKLAQLSYDDALCSPSFPILDLLSALRQLGSSEILVDHFENETSHVRGCWALDLILGNE